ncbi:MAG: AAA family ATPase [Lachnospiraceae bacterium]|nr:AAA family ATPase [Lachnospiraceae bacterium]
MNFSSPLQDWSPQAVYRCLDKEIMGQEKAKRAISVLFYNCLEGRRSTNLLMGSTGTGKTELFRCLRRHYPGRVVVVDASALSAEGWNGANSTHLSSILRNNPEIGKMPTLLVFDEFDKCIRPAYGSRGTNYADLLQDNFLKMADGDLVEFGEGSSFIQTDFFNVSIVFMGAFADLKVSADGHRPVGFCPAPGVLPAASGQEEISVDDLIQYGLKRELAGRIQRLIRMEELSFETMLQIAKKTVFHLSQEYNSSIWIDTPSLEQMAQAALDSGLGARFIRSCLLERMDAIQFEDPSAAVYDIRREASDGPEYNVSGLPWEYEMA